MNNSSKSTMKINTDNDDDDDEITIKCEEPYNYPPVFCKVEMESHELTCDDGERYHSDPFIQVGKNNTNIIEEENKEMEDVKEDIHHFYAVSCYETLTPPNNTDALNIVQELQDNEDGIFSRVYGENTSKITVKKGSNSLNEGLNISQDICNIRAKGKKIHQSQRKHIQKTQRRNTQKSIEKNIMANKKKPKRKLLIQKEIKFYLCSHCYKCFTSQVRYKNHLTSHGVKREKYKKLSNSHCRKKLVSEGMCDKCGKSITSTSSLKDHMAVHEGVKNYQCDICNKLFMTKSYLRFHLHYHKSTNYICDSCGKCYFIKHSLKEHLKSHDVRPKEKYMCKVCYKCYAYSKNLEDHIYNVHAKIKVYVCHICDTTLTSRQGLRRHSLIHKGCKNYMCEICKKQFSRKDNLRVYILSHEKLTHKKI